MDRRFPSAITYWAATPDGYGGYTFTSPVAMTGRWENKTERTVDSNGVEIVCRSVVYLSADVAVEGFLYLGTSTSASPLSVTGAQQIRRFDKTPDLRNVTYERKAIL